MGIRQQIDGGTLPEDVVESGSLPGL